MRRTEKATRNNISYFPPSIKLVLRVAVLVLCAWLIYKVGVPVAGIIGGYILIRSVLKIIRLSISVICSILSILFLIGVIALIITFIF